MTTVRAITATASLALVGALSLPMLGALAQQAAADDVPGVTTLRLFEHDTQQTSIDLGERGTGPGDEFLFAGDVFDRPGGTLLGHTAGRCTTLSGNSTTGDVMCVGTIALAGGEIILEGVADRAALFQRGETVSLAITGGTGTYSNARGDATVQVPPEVPNQTDANFVLNVMSG